MCAYLPRSRNGSGLDWDFKTDYRLFLQYVLKKIYVIAKT